MDKFAKEKKEAYDLVYDFAFGRALIGSPITNEEIEIIIKNKSTYYIQGVENAIINANNDVKHSDLNRSRKRIIG